MVKSEIKDLKAFQNKLKKRMVTNPEKHLKGLVQRSTTIVEGTAKQSIASGNKTGRTYMKGGVSHTASAPGEPPATDTGKLVEGITSKVRSEGTKVIGEIIANSFNITPYAKDLEFGTKNMRPRPYMQPALERNRPKIKRIFKEGGYVD